MSHQTGISACPKLIEFFGRNKNSDTRLIKVKIENEKLVLDTSCTVQKSWEEDYDVMILPLLEERQPSYILYRLDKESHGGFEWIFILWSPDDSPVRQKMLYASTKATLKKEFGTAQINLELFGTIKDDVSLDGLHRQQQSDAAPAPLTTREEEINELKRLEADADVGVDSRHQTLTGVSFPVTSNADDALKRFADGLLQYVQVFIDLEKEEIQLSTTYTSLDVEYLPNQIPDTCARYHLYRYDHNYEGDFYHSVVFIYSMPGYSCPIRERMLYSSSKNPLIEHLESALNLQIMKKVEISEGSELTVDFLLNEIHPKMNVHCPQFAKPKGPANRGARRLTKEPKDGVRVLL